MSCLHFVNGHDRTKKIAYELFYWNELADFVDIHEEFIKYCLNNEVSLFYLNNNKIITIISFFIDGRVQYLRLYVHVQCDCQNHFVTNRTKAANVLCYAQYGCNKCMFYF